MVYNPANLILAEKFKTYFGGKGSITVIGNTMSYRESLVSLGPVIAHFKAYPLQSSKFFFLCGVKLLTF